MNFDIDSNPPNQEAISREISSISMEIKQLTNKDTLITFILISLTSLGAGAAVYWTTDNYYYAGGAIAVFPILGTILSLLGITKSAGFRSAAVKIADLKNELAALNPVSQHDMNDVEKLCGTHNLVAQYQNKVKAQGRSAVNGELAMYWEFDTSTMAKTAKGRDYLEKAKESVKG